MLYYVSNAVVPARKAHTIQQMRMCDAFAGHGFDVTFLHPSYGLSETSVEWSTVASFYDLQHHFDITTVPTIGESTPEASRGTTLSMLTSMTAWLSWAALTGRLGGSDIVYGRNYYGLFPFNEIRRLIPEYHRPTVVFEQHGPVSAHWKNRFFRTIDHCICLSGALRDRNLRTFDFDPDQCSVVHHGVDTRSYHGLDRDSARDSLGISTDERVVAYTGHLYPRKGVETLVAAASDIDATVYIVGGYEDDIERVKRTVGSPENVVFTGFVEPSEIPTYQVAADVLVAPYTDADLSLNSPLKLFEYIAAKRPIVASDRPTVREVLTDSENALFFQPGSVTDLRSCLGRVLGDADTAARLRDGVATMATTYSYDRRAERILECIEPAGQ